MKAADIIKELEYLDNHKTESLSILDSVLVESRKLITSIRHDSNESSVLTSKHTRHIFIESHDYMAGHCHVMAIALKKLYPDWQIRARIGWEDDREDDDYLVDHVYIVAPDGAAYDCRGQFENEQQLVGPDETNAEETQLVNYSLADIKADIARGELKAVSKQDIAHATIFARQIIKQDVAEGKYSGPMHPLTTKGTAKGGAVTALEQALVRAKKHGTVMNYKNIDSIMQKICKSHNITGQKLHDDFVKKHNLIPDNWIKKQDLTQDIEEVIKADVFKRGFNQTEEFGKYTLVATPGRFLLHQKPGEPSDQFTVRAYLEKLQVAWVNFEMRDDHLEALDLYVSPEHRRKGIATAMYRFAKKIGNDIEPSKMQTGMGKKFWATKSPVSMAENFADGKHPERKGDSARHGIPKHASLAQLDKMGHGSGRKAQLARWQANMKRGRAKNEGIEEDKNTDTAISLTKLGKFHRGADTLAELVPERATAQYALHPDKWESTFYSLTNKDSDKLKHYGPKTISIPPGTLVGDMAIANKFYRAKTTEEKEQYAELYRQSLKPYPVDVSKYRMPELLIPRQSVAEGVPQPGKSSGKPISWISPEQVITKYLTLDEILNSVQGIPYYNEVVKDRDAKNFTWGVTKKVIEYAKELIVRPNAYKNWPPIIVVDNKLQDGAHRISTINLMQKRVQPNSSIWKNAKLKVEFGKSDNVKQDVEEGWKEWAAAGAIGLGGLGALSTNSTPDKDVPVDKPAVVQPAPAEQPKEKEVTTLTANKKSEELVQRAAKAAGIEGAELAQFMAQTKHESADFSRMKEAGGSKYFTKKYDPKYAPGTAKILGNKHEGDGERYHGRGYIQITGRYNYRMAGKALGIPLEDKPELAARPDIAAEIAVWFWQTHVSPNVQNFDNIKAVTRKINPAMRGLEDRYANYIEYKKLL